jgi:hypothetical protein
VSGAGNPSMKRRVVNDAFTIERSRAYEMADFCPDHTDIKRMSRVSRSKIDFTWAERYDVAMTVVAFSTLSREL